jgi:hypothetical protein
MLAVFFISLIKDQGFTPLPDIKRFRLQSVRDFPEVSPMVMKLT